MYSTDRRFSSLDCRWLPCCATTFTRSGGPYPGTESKGLFTGGARYTRGSYRLDGGVFWGLTAVSPSVGFTVGLTMVFNAFEVP